MQTFTDLRGQSRPPSDLPLFDAPATVRTFDSPEFRDVTFYEVEAKSILNRVPAASRMPFEWTINVYRGCSHACSYCQAGDTPILMADGRTKPLADVRAGDTIYGTVRDGAYRRYVATNVVDHWSTVKPAYRVTLEDGTELVDERRPPLPERPGMEARHRVRAWPEPAAAPDPEQQADGDGSVRGTARRRAGLSTWLPVRDDPRRRARRHLFVSATRPGSRDVHRFRLALVDLEAIRRARTYLARLDVPTNEFAFKEAVGEYRAHHRDPHVDARRRGLGRAHHRLAAIPVGRLAQGLPGRHLRRRGQSQSRDPAHLQHRSGHRRPDHVRPSAVRVRVHHREPTDNQRQAPPVRAGAGRSA